MLRGMERSPDPGSADPSRSRVPALVSSALDVLATGVDSYAAWLRPSGELHDPVFDRPTQYGTAYHALGNAVLAAVGPEEQREAHLDRAVRGLDAALAHTADVSRPPAASGFDPATGATTAGNHRDFTWPPILKTYRLLRELGAERADEFGRRIAEVDVLASFRSRPPSNWASVWLSGEWIRFEEGLSPFGRSDVDDWLAVFFAESIDLDRGFYAEPGLPNSYDLFTRYHLADLLAEGYDGRWRAELWRLLETGLERSLAVQLSDGSLASAHRSAGQTWTLGAQVAYFTHASRLLAEARPDDAARAVHAAERAFCSLRRYQRPGGPFSPVENVLPPTYRVGYERYTADAHYANLALGFLAVAVLAGFTGTNMPGPGAHAPRAADPRPRVRIENEPTYRAVLHAGELSAAVTAAPAPGYDAFGLTDLTFGAGRRLHFASSVRHAASGRFFNPGLDTGEEPPTRGGPLEPDGPSGVRLVATTADGRRYTQRVVVDPERVTVTEELGGADVLFVPYLRDPGTGVITTVEYADSTLTLVHGSERVRVEVDAPVERCVVLEHGFANRRGLCGLVRLELGRTAATPLTYRIGPA